MSALSNTPQQPSMLTLASRKSFSFTVQFLDNENRPLSLEGASINFTIGQQSYSDTPILTKAASSINAGNGAALFDLQASQLDLTPGVYPWEIVVVTEGYSSMVLNGELEIVPSYEIGSLNQTYAEAPSTFGLVAQMKHNRLIVTSSSLVLQGPEGPQGAPGRDGNPFGLVNITYDVDGRIASLTIDGQTTSYSYNVDGTIAYDERGGITRTYNYTDGVLTSIVPETIGA